MSRREELTGPFLPKATLELLARTSPSLFPLRSRNIGLQLDKFGVYAANDASMRIQKDALQDVTKIGGDKRLLVDLIKRRRGMLAAIGAHTVRMRTAGPLTLHLARAGTWENAGICLHPMSGFAYMPGSGLKGMVRAWAETVWAGQQPDPEVAWRRIEQLFGYATNSETHKIATKERGWRPEVVPVPDGSAAGRLVFHEAWPTVWPNLVVDVANIHYAKYYRGEDAPGDWDSPVPVYFLSMSQGAEFEFAVSDRARNEDGSLELAISWLVDALQAEGAGAKTAAGYGRFCQSGKEKIEIPEAVTQVSYDLELVSPAFLAGASQQESDCELRGSTLRGLLRWWWRTMFAGLVGCDTLRGLEAAVWGSSSIGSPLRIAVQVQKSLRPVQFDKSEVFLRKLGIRKRRNDHIATLGLYYTSYGMAEQKRWCQPPGSSWKMSITAKDGFLQQSDETTCRLDAKDIIKQASAAMWLLAQYGGIGSKSRKGFGSLNPIQVEGVASLNDCTTLAQGLLRKWNVALSSDAPYAPSLAEAFEMPSIRTAWENPWFACHILGKVHREAALDLKRNERIVLGLPRKGQSVRGVDRHASTVHWSLGRNANGPFDVRLMAFPSPKLLRWDKCCSALKTYSQEARARIYSHRNSRAAGPGIIHDESLRSPAPVPPPSRTPKAGDQVEVLLLEEKTKKGKWKALHEDSGLKGVVQDDIPLKVEPGKRLPLFVHSINELRGDIIFRHKPQSRISRSGRNVRRKPSDSRRRRRRRR